MLAYVVRRAVFTLGIAFCTTAALFVVTHMIPSDPAIAMLSDKAPPEVLEAFRRRWGLDRSLPAQYGIYLWSLASGDLGTSIRTGQPILRDISRHLPATMELAVAAMLVSSLGGMVLGVLSALNHGRGLDIAVRTVSLGGVSAPVFWMGVMMIFVFYYLLDWLPPGGRLNALLREPPRLTGLYTIDFIVSGDVTGLVDSLRHLILPALSLGTYYLAFFVRLVRSGVLEELQRDYVRTARAKGLGSVRILGHALKNALIPVLSFAGIVFGSLLSGAIVTETIFSWPGLGRYAFQNALTLDFPAIAGVTLTLGLMFVVVNFAVDMLQLGIDPRLRDTAR